MAVTVVTGAARGMGRACLERLRGTSEHLIAVDLRAPDIDGVVGVTCDISDPAALARLVDQVRDLGAFRGLAHAAGITPTMADSRRVFEVDLVGTQLLLDAFEPLVQPGSAAVCFASSSAYQVGADPKLDALIENPRAADFLDRAAAVITDSNLAYPWAKRGVIRAAAQAAVSWGPRGGRVNSISPGLIQTPAAEQEMQEHPMMRVMLEKTPLGRIGQPQEAAALVAFLLSDDASFVSGVDVLVDGGMMQGLRT